MQSDNPNNAYTAILAQKPLDYSNSIVGSGQFCTVASGAYSTIIITDQVGSLDLLVFQTRGS
jgi:hypothetical protein